MSVEPKAIQYLHLPAGSSPPVLSGAPFKAVMILETDHTAEWRHEISDWLVESGCRYMMAWGRDCSLWNDSVDWSTLAAYGWDVDIVLDDERFVMTTWHTGEPLSEVFWFAGSCAFHPTLDLELILIDVSPEPREAAILAAYAAAQEDEPDEP